TDTYDASGRVTSAAPVEAVAALGREAVSAAMGRFQGAIEQKPPPYSAKKVGGVKFYELARRGEEVPAEPKEVTIFEFSLQGELVDGVIHFRLGCSSGTYARGLAHDLGAALGVGGHLAALRRVQIGSFHVESAILLGKLDEVAESGGSAGAAWVPFDQIPLPFGEVTTDPQQEQRISHGQTVLVRELCGEEGDWVKLVNKRRQFIAIGTVV
ncbi:MAG: tRNA pseudouridine(55) synthase TruB, partial [Acidobacteriota bacterium]|nr:tRNA pseudouridine(55) synthase TruB [Acidobacteriota bacterium]